MRAAGYVRVSTEEQAREGYGLAAQEQAVRAYCQAQGWELLQVYADAGRSGKSMRGREALTRLLTDADDRQFERVIFLKLDRLARNLRDLLDICDRLEAREVGIVSIQEAIDTGTAAGRMVRSFLGAVAEFERETIVERIKAGIAEKARQGELVGPVPVGYRRGDGGIIVPDPAVAPLISAAFTRYATGQHSLRQMAEWANGAGLRSTLGNPIDRLSIRKILGNISYTGQVAFHRRRGDDRVVEGKHPPIIDEALFTAVQQRLRDRRRAAEAVHPFGRSPYPLSGTSVCIYCSSNMLGVKAGKHGRRYMRCSTAARRGRDACRQPMVPAEGLEAQMAAYAGGMQLPTEYLREVVAELRRRRQPDSAAEARRLEREIERWRRLYVLDEIDEERLQREITPLKRRLAEVDRPHEVLNVERAAGYLLDVGRLWAESPREVQREFVKEVFARVVVEDQQLAAITPKEAYAPLFALDRQERFGGDFARIEGGVVWLPARGENPNFSPVQPPRRR